MLYLLPGELLASPPPTLVGRAIGHEISGLLVIRPKLSYSPAGAPPQREMATCDHSRHEAGAIGWLSQLRLRRAGTHCHLLRPALISDGVKPGLNLLIWRAQY
mmetsp:Transcript_772/g.2757  ORF Transcript_772/g.2757 Transcript_772/m.2757 type:complete len:103 (+) Transcript_772:1410-1718(+)